MERDTWWKDDEEDSGSSDPLSLAMQEAERQADAATKRQSGGSSYQYPDERWTDEDEKQDQQRRAEGKPNRPFQPTSNPIRDKRTTAKDGQSLQTQDANTQMNFRIRYGQEADAKWVEEHEQEIDNIARGMPAKPASGQSGTTPATVVPTSPPATVARAGATTVASGAKPWLAQGWSPAPTDVVSITMPDGKVTEMTGQYFLEQQAGGFTQNHTQYITGVRPGTDATSRVISGVDAGPTVNTSRDPRTIGAPDAPSALVGSGTAQVGAAAPGSVPSATTSSAAPTPKLPPGAPPKPTGQPGDERAVLIQRPDGSYYWQTPEYVRPGEKVVPLSNQTDAESPTRLSHSVGTGRTAVTPAAAPVSTPNISRPLDSLVQMTGKPPQESQRIAQGISALLRGDASAAWVEPYLNDVARLAWAEQQKAQGINADPLDAPADYLESWKDGFYGSDHSVPLVKELDQQMIDYAADKSRAEGKPFDWRVAFGPTGEDGLISRQVTDRDCGTNSFANILRSRGYNVDPESTYRYGRQKGYHDGEQFTGPYNMSRMLREEAGLNAQTIPMDWAAVNAELDQGRPVVLSSGGHYWTISAKREGPNGTEYYGGATSQVVSNPEWATAGQIRYGGAPNYMIVVQGDVNPNAPAVRELGLKPPGTQNTRTLLSSGTRAQAEQRIRMSAQQSAPPSGTGADAYEQTAWEAGQKVGADPIMILAMLDQESSGNPEALSRAGASGLMQLMPETAAELGVTNRNDPKQSIYGGATYFKRMLDRYDGNVDLALAAYNAGPGAVDKFGGIPPYEETQRYVRDVKAKYAARQQRYAGMR